MLQKINTVPALGAVLTILTAVLVVQKPYLGLKSIKINQPQIELKLADPSSQDLFAYESKPQEYQIVEPAKENEGKNEQRVGSLTSEKEEEKPFIDTINKTLPPVFEKQENPKEEIISLIRKFAKDYGVNEEMMIAIAKCESGFNHKAISPSGTYRGIYQFVNSTWQSNRRAMGLDDNPELVFNAEEAIRTAAFKMSRDGFGAWPVCSQKALSNLASKTPLLE